MDIDVMALAAMIYGENASEDYDTMVMTGSTALNRLESTRDKEFGSTLPEVLNKGYRAVSDNSPMYQQALSGKFPDEKSETKFKQAMQIAYGLKKGTIERTPGMFYFTDEEKKKLKKSEFDFSQVKQVGKTKRYKVYSY